MPLRALLEINPVAKGAPPAHGQISVVKWSKESENDLKWLIFFCGDEECCPERSFYPDGMLPFRKIDPVTLMEQREQFLDVRPLLRIQQPMMGVNR
jgi:hypothetical protein